MNDLVAPLFTPQRIGSLTLTNRFVMPGMQRGMASDGRPTAAMAEHYRRRIEGGCGLVITESTAVDHPSASHQPSCVWMMPECRDGWRRCIEAVREAGGEIFIQLWHEGAHRPETGPWRFSGHPTISPSGLSKAGEGHGKPATIAQLHELRDAFVRSAQMAQDLGASGIELHAAHGYFLDQTLWAVSNRRDDEYGGESLANRMRLGREIVEGIRKATGPDFPISIRFSQWKEADYNAKVFHDPSELEEFVTAFRQSGVDAFHVSTRHFARAEWPDSPLTLAGWVKRFTDAAVIAVGSVGLDIDIMQTLRENVEARSNIEAGLEELTRRFGNGEFDFIAIGRGQLGDPDWVSKVREGRLSEIRHFTRADILTNVKWDAPATDDSHKHPEPELENDP